jgi:hypothetical protein
MYLDYSLGMWLGAICGAATLALAAILGLAAIVPALATTVAFARVLALTGVLFNLLGGVRLVLTHCREGCLRRGEHGGSFHSRAGPCEQASHRRTSNESLGCKRHGVASLQLKLFAVSDRDQP